jgi:hypothetical protein
MDEIGTGPTKPLRRHLLAPQAVTRSADTCGGADQTRSRGQGNGVRAHGIYFAVVSLAALVLVIVAIAVASTSM